MANKNFHSPLFSLGSKQFSFFTFLALLRRFSSLHLACRETSKRWLMGEVKSAFEPAEIIIVWFANSSATFFCSSAESFQPFASAATFVCRVSSSADHHRDLWSRRQLLMIIKNYLRYSPCYCRRVVGPAEHSFDFRLFISFCRFNIRHFGYQIFSLISISLSNFHELLFEAS